MTDIILTHEVNIRAYEALLTVGVVKEERSQDILPFLKMVDELGSVDAADVNTHFLLRKQPNHIFGIRWLASMLDYGYIRSVYEWQGDLDGDSNKFKLSQLGKLILSEGKVLIPEYGNYLLHTTDDPLFIDKLLAYKKIENGSTKDAYFNERDRALKKGSRLVGTMPAKDIGMDAWVDNVIRLVAQKNEPIRIIDSGERVSGSNEAIKVHVRVVLEEEGRTRIFVTNGESSVELDRNFPMNYVDAVRSIAENGGYEFDERGNAVLIKTYQITEDIVRAGSLTLPPADVEIDELGTYSSIALKGVEVSPYDLEAAVSWATKYLTMSVIDYCSESDYDRLRERTSEMFEPRFERSVMLRSIPDYKEMINEIISVRGERDKEYWMMMAPYDLGRRMGR